MARLRKLGIVVGTRCTFDCRHCLLDKRTRNQSLREREKRLLCEVVRKYAPASLSFTGGETTLYVDDINRISSAFPKNKKLNLGIVTNGGFASSVAEAGKVLASIRGLSYVQMSYDKFHSEFAPKSRLENLLAACRESGIGFRAVTTLQSPLDLKITSELAAIGKFEVAVQKICDIGEAKKNGVAFRHFVFDKKVLAQTCPNRDQLVYQCGKGFSICCSNLIYNGLGKYCLHKTPEDHFNSGFYKLMRSAVLGRLFARHGGDPGSLRPEHSSACALCEHIFNTTEVTKTWTQN